MYAHPMITPLLPLRLPEQVEGGYPSDSAKAYALIWENTLAHLKSPQTAEECICRYQAGTQIFGVRTVFTSDKLIEAVLPELDERRIDAPLFPAGGLTVPNDGTMTIQSAEIEFVPRSGRGADVAALIDWANALRIVSPGRLGSIVEELEAAGWIARDGLQYSLTQAGEFQLNAVDSMDGIQVDGLAIARWRSLFDEYPSNGDGLEQLLSGSNKIFGTSLTVPLGELENLVTGTYSAEDAYALRDQEALKASLSVKFPAGMDPERLIASDDPLREKRNRLEDQLSSGRAHIWLCLSAAERTAIRFGAELAELPIDEERQKFMESVLFDVRFRWLIGLSAEMSLPSKDGAMRAYLAWQAGGSEA